MRDGHRLVPKGGGDTEKGHKPNAIRLQQKECDFWLRIPIRERLSD